MDRPEVNAWLEERPVLVFDEWAADQDPAFRRIFYTELLPDLKRLGKTIIVILNNGVFGTIRMHQAREYPHRRAGTELVNPDFVQLAQSYGYAAERVTRTEEFEPALRAALARAEGTVIEVILSDQVITTRVTLDTIEEKAAAAKAA